MDDCYYWHNWNFQCGALCNFWIIFFCFVHLKLLLSEKGIILVHRSEALDILKFRPFRVEIYFLELRLIFIFSSKVWRIIVRFSRIQSERFSVLHIYLQTSSRLDSFKLAIELIRLEWRKASWIGKEEKPAFRIWYGSGLNKKTKRSVADWSKLWRFKWINTKRHLFAPGK